MSNETVSIANFPERMTVDSPKTDQQLDALKISFENLYGLLQDNFNILIRQSKALDEMPALFQNLEQVIQNQFEMGFLRQFEVTIMSHQAEILAEQSRIEALQGFLNGKQAQLEESLANLQKRYGELLGQVSDNNQERRHKLDSHAYDLLEQVYPGLIQERFSNISLPSYSYLAAHASECAQARTAGLMEGFKAAEQAVRAFLEDGQDFYAGLQNMISTDVRPGHYRLKVYAIEVEDRETGERSLRFRIAGQEEDLPEDLQQALKDAVAGKMHDGPDSENLSAEDARQLCREMHGAYKLCPEELSRLKTSILNSNLKRA